MSATAGQTPLPPPLPISRSSQPPPTQVEFLLSQVRATLRYLSEIGSFDPATYRQIHELLSQGVIDQHSVPASASSTRAAPEAQPEEPGKKNAWLRKTLSETSILPTTVETALSLAAGPLLSDDQKSAIVQLVEYSQKGVANKITDPSLQKRTLSGAKTAQSSTTRAVTGWSRSFRDSREKKRMESVENKESKKREKQEKKQIQEELKRERHEMIRLRQQQMLQGGAVAENRGSETSTLHQSIGSSNMQEEDSSSSDQSNEDDHVQHTAITNHGPTNHHQWHTGVNSIADTATLTVLSDPVTDSAAGSRVGGTSTAFVIEPGLAISCSLVVVKGSSDLGPKPDSAKGQTAFGSALQPPVIETAHPPPPPSHPEVLAIRRQSGVETPQLGAGAQPPIPPRPNAVRPS